jgi:ElaB/YqjD/DUF883 family membrane-anchored ribosome-binding protein
MESTVNERDGAVRAGTATFKASAGGAAPLNRENRENRGEEFDKLMTDVQALLEGVGHVVDPEIGRLRRKVEEAMAATNWMPPGRMAEVRRRAKHMLSAGNGYVRDRPWQSAGIAALAGVVVGILVGRR